MVVEQGIVPKPLGNTIGHAISRVIADQAKPGSERSGDYLKVEPLLIAQSGPDVTRLHSGRSRQDIRATTRRLFQRDYLLSAIAQLNEARASLIAMAEKLPNAIVPAYTLGVQAQPVSFGHYILAYGEALARDGERYREAYARLNRSPLGAAALGASSFPVNRPRLATLLGFDGPIENSFDANQISPIDTGVELCAIAASSALTLTTPIADITTQYAQTKPWLLRGEGKETGTSSIMPQKRNPLGLLGLRSTAGKLVGDAQVYFLLAHNVSAGMTDYKTDEPDRVLMEAADLYSELAKLMKDLALHPKRALDEVNAEYSTTTELADTLQRVADVPFRVGHHFASELVNFGRSHGLTPSQLPYDEAQRNLYRSRETVRLAEREATPRRSPVPPIAHSREHGGGKPGPRRPAARRSRTHAHSPKGRNFG
jgi:argininosuccinate lyase